MDIKVTDTLTVNGAYVASLSKEDWMKEARAQGTGALNGPEEQDRILEDAWNMSVAAHPELVPAPPAPEAGKGKGKNQQ